MNNFNNLKENDENKIHINLMLTFNLLLALNEEKIF
jgi:hypothetical protein